METLGVRPLGFKLPVASLCSKPAEGLGSLPKSRPDSVVIRFRGSSIVTFPAQLPKEVDVTGFTGGKQILINGELKPWAGATQPVESVVMLSGPDGKLSPIKLGELAWMDATTAAKALTAAKKAYNGGQGAWPQASLNTRIAATETFITEMQKQRETIAKLIMLEIGKNSKDAYKEFDRTVEYIRDTLVEARKMAEAEGKTEKIGEQFVKQAWKPTGVTLCFGPSNYPINETFTTLIPALLMGNPIICKLPRYGALSMAALFEPFAKSFPKGTVNFISGDGKVIVPPIMKSGDITNFAFIGSTGAAEGISSQHPKRLILNDVLGLAAKNPAIILKGDEPTDAQVKEIVSGALSFNGQRCTALKIIFAPATMAESVANKVAAQVNQLKGGMPYEPDTQITPVPLGEIQRYKDLLDDAVAKGAKVMNPGGGEVHGTFFKPAVLYPVTPGMRLYTEEQFGPLVPVAAYEKPKEVIHYLNGLGFTQQASIFGGNDTSRQKWVDQLATIECRVNINQQCMRGPDSIPFVGRGSAAKKILSIKDALYAFALPVVLSGKTEAEINALSVSGKKPA